MYLYVWLRIDPTGGILRTWLGIFGVQKIKEVDAISRVLSMVNNTQNH
jgi:hypothetical protein